ncbi:MAG: efflux RND transporter periplasmic adaptor subunit [Myxococcales bacterium]|nr:efflux RND transporter periplasmic adaptor subunit [Myxococcales bacterium]MDH3843394.1 efflux RND transporter periplasmic adaptor subunit [Myxococcales bacterium]
MTRRRQLGLKWALSIAVLLVSIGGAWALVATKDEPPRADKPLEGTLVEVIEVQGNRHEVELHAKGTVVPAKEVVLQTELGGRVIWQSPELVPGGRFEEGQPILKIDARDYKLAVESFRSQVNRAKLDLRLEARRGEVAKREWNAFGEIDASEDQRALAQREPQLEASRLALKAAQSSLKKAELDLARTTLRAPFNAMVVSESVDTGQLLSPQTAVARLVGTDQYHVQVSVPVVSLRTMNVRSGDEPGSEVSVVQRVGQETIERKGELIRKLPDLDPGGAMARILVSIEDPLGDGEGLPLLLGSFVDVAVAAAPIENAVRVPRGALHNGRDVYVMNDDDLLEIRTVQIAWTEPDSVLVSGGLEPDERVVISRIPTPIPNMLLRTAGQEPATEAESPSEPAAAAIP